MGVIDNTANNGVITAGLITTMADTVNQLYDFCVDLGLQQDTSSKRAILTDQNKRNYGADEIRFFIGRYGQEAGSYPGTKTMGWVAYFKIDYGIKFASLPALSVTAERGANKQGLIVNIDSPTESGFNAAVWNNNTHAYEGTLVINVIAVGAEASNM